MVFHEGGLEEFTASGRSAKQWVSGFLQKKGRGLGPRPNLRHREAPLETTRQAAPIWRDSIVISRAFENLQVS